MLFCGCLLSIFSISSQTYSTCGTDFWMVFMKNGHYPIDSVRLTTLSIASEHATNGTITNPNTGYSIDFSVDEDGVTQITIPMNEAYHDESEIVKSLGLHVTAADSVFLFASNHLNHCSDATAVLPTRLLSNRYIVQGYSGINNYGSEFIVLATENNTVVSITPKTATFGGHSANVPFQITLQQGESYFGVCRT